MLNWGVGSLLCLANEYLVAGLDKASCSSQWFSKAVQLSLIRGQEDRNWTSWLRRDDMYGSVVV